MTKYQPINLAQKFSLFNEYWQPKVIAELNDYQFKVAKIKGDFVWHKHDDTDEAFFVLYGALKIEFRDGTVKLEKGEMFVVKKGVEHRPCAQEECHILLMEPAGVVNTGDAESELTAANDVWI